MSKNIPDDVKKQIDDKADKYGFQVPFDGTNKFYNDDKVKGFQDGATFGYSLAASQLEDKEKEIERLRGLIGRMYNEFIRAAENTSPAVSADNWRKFQEQNNL